MPMSISIFSALRSRYASDLGRATRFFSLTGTTSSPTSGCTGFLTPGYSASNPEPGDFCAGGRSAALRRVVSNPAPVGLAIRDISISLFFISKA